MSDEENTQGSQSMHHEGYDQASRGVGVNTKHSHFNDGNWSKHSTNILSLCKTFNTNGSQKVALCSLVGTLSPLHESDDSM